MRNCTIDVTKTKVDKLRCDRAELHLCFHIIMQKGFLMARLMSDCIVFAETEASILLKKNGQLKPRRVLM